MVDMEVVTVLTYICACIGGLLLLACTVLVCLVIYVYCKKHDLIPNSFRHHASTREYAMVSRTLPQLRK